MISPQKIAFHWALQTYGSAVHGVRYQAFRFIEEALELVQAMGLTKEDVSRTVEYVFARRRGDAYEEFGDVRLTLDIMAESLHISSDDAYENCLLRVAGLDILKARAKDQAKIAAGLI